MKRPTLLPFARPPASAAPPRPAAWRKPNCLICDAPEPRFGIDCDPTKGEVGHWFCRGCVPPDFFEHADASAQRAS